MAAHLTRTLLKRTQVNDVKFGLQFVRLGSYWNKDFKPAPYPKTEAERIAAAKKYGLLPQDYEPYPDDGTGFGDYPKLTLVSNDQRDPFVDWDFPDMKRNYGEPMHVDWDMFTEDRMSNARYRYTADQMLKSFVIVIGTIFGLFGLFEYNDWKMDPRRGPKHYPQPGKVHYTFEPLD